MPGQIVVGIDASEEAQAALRWAVQEASFRSASVTAVHVWHDVIASGGLDIQMIDPSQLEAAAQSMASSTVALVEEEMGGFPRPVTIQLAHGHPGRALLDAAEGADLLVVGSRGHGGFTGLLLGSVATYVVHHASLPVAVVPLGGH